MGLTQSRLKELLVYNPETGVFMWSDKRGYNMGGRRAGCLRNDGYLRIRIDGDEWHGHRLAWIWVYGCPAPKYIDHIDGDPGNNRISNLREATQSQNLANTKLSAANTSGHKGISLDRRRGKWAAQKKIEGVKYSLGYYKDKADAVEVYEVFSILMLGEFHRQL